MLASKGDRGPPRESVVTEGASISHLPPPGLTGIRESKMRDPPVKANADIRAKGQYAGECSMKAVDRAFGEVAGARNLPRDPGICEASRGSGSAS